jgi:hypothetical protein
MWKYIAGALGLGLVGYGVKTQIMDKTPQIGDTALVPMNNLTVPGLAAGAFNPLGQLGNAAVNPTLQVKITALPFGGSATAPYAATAGAGIPVQFVRSGMTGLQRAGKTIF